MECSKTKAAIGDARLVKVNGTISGLALWAQLTADYAAADQRRPVELLLSTDGDWKIFLAPNFNLRATRCRKRLDGC